MAVRASAAVILILFTASSANAQLNSRESDGSAAVAGSRPAGSVEGRFSGGVRTALTLSDNIDLADDGESGGSILEIGPYVSYSVDRVRLQTDLTYSPRYFNTSGELGADGVRHDLSGKVKAALWKDTLWINGLATVTEATRDPINQGTLDPARQDGSRTTLQRYAIAPYFSNYLGDRNTSLVVGYGLSFAKDSSRDEGQITQRLVANVSRDTNTRGLGWAIEAEQSNTGFESSEEDYDTSRLTVEALLRANGKFRLGAGVQYDRITVVRDDLGDDSGLSPTLSALWTPNQRTQFSARYAKPYYGSTAAANLAYRPNKWAVGVQYSYGLTDTFSGPLATTDVESSLSPGDRPASESSVVSQLLADGVLPAFGSTLTSGFVAGAISRTRRLTLNVGWSGRRTSYGISAARVRSETLATTIDLPMTAGAPTGIRQTLVSFRASRKIDRRTNVGANLTTTTSAATDDSAKSQLDTLTLSWSRQINKQLEVFTAYRLAHQKNRRGQTAAYREQAIVMGANYRYW